MTPKVSFRLVLITAAGLYTLFLPYYFVGYFNDDALYILSALSLWKGQFIASYLPHQPPQTAILCRRLRLAY